MRKWMLIGALVVAGCGSDKTATFAARTTTAPVAAAAVESTTLAPTTTLRATTLPPTTVAPTTVAVARDVLHTAGKNTTDTDVFTVDGVWQIACKVNGGAGVAAEIKKPNGSSSDYVSFSTGDGVSTKRQGGTFYLTMTPFGSSFDCTVTDLPG